MLQGKWGFMSFPKPFLQINANSLSWNFEPTCHLYNSQISLSLSLSIYIYIYMTSGTGTRNLKQQDVCVKVKVRCGYQHPKNNWNLFVLVNNVTHRNPHQTVWSFSGNGWKLFLTNCVHCKVQVTRTKLDFIIFLVILLFLFISTFWVNIIFILTIILLLILLNLILVAFYHNMWEILWPPCL